MATRLKLGLVGAGPAAERIHVPAIRGVPEVKAWMVADVNPEQARRIAGLVPFEHVANQAEKLIGKVDLAILALPAALHAPIACKLLEAGIHVLCEKPMARNVAECNQMLVSSAKSGALLCIGHNRRFRPNVTEAKKIIERGLLGGIERIEAEEGSQSDWPRSKAYFDAAVAGGGALLDVGIHSVDLIRFLVGDFSRVEYLGNQTPQMVESDCVMRFELVSGANGTIASSRNKELRQRIVFYGSKGALTVGLWKPELILSNGVGKAFSHFQQLNLNPVRRSLDPSSVELLRRFAVAIQTKEPSPISGEDGLEAVRIVEWAYKGKRPR